MFVLADIEWIINPVGHISPTQLAAIRVNEDWIETDRFASFIRPRIGEFYDRNHVAYNGGTADEFHRARIAVNVLRSFLEWLSEDDIILWWYDESDAIFKKLVSIIFKTQLTNKTIAISGYVHAFLDGKTSSLGNAYRIAEARGINTNPNLMHFSVNDAIVMQKLMQKLGYPQSELLKPLVRIKNEPTPTKQSLSLPYQYDPAANTIHIKDCPTLLEGRIATQGFATLKTPLRKGFKPCECCKEEYRKAFKERNADILKRSQYNFVYAADSKVFHKSTCSAMLSAKSILGAIKYETVAKTGRKPCKLCKPAPDDTYKPIPPKLKVTRLQKQTKRTVGKEDAKAIIRQKVATEERYRLLKDDSLTQQERSDVYTLTQPRFAFWVGQGYRTFHLHSCPKLREITNLRGFSTYNDAIRAGFSPCRKCKPTAKHDLKVSVPITNKVRENEKIEDLEAMCIEAGYTHYREGAYLFLETPVGKWRVNVSEAPVKLDHINIIMTPDAKNYHEQPRIFLSFVDTFNYIKRHDEELERKAAEGRVFVKFIEK